MRWTVVFVLVCVVCVGCNSNSDVNRTDIHQTTGSDSTASSEGTNDVAPDNTAINSRDRKAGAKTPFDQSNTQPDLDITAKIRQRVVDLAGLSVDARNVKIITNDGKVTLRGPVKNDEERSAVERIARDVAGPANVDNQLDITDQN